MCGIAGIVERNEKTNIETAIGLMTDSMAHRGPDDSGIHVVPLEGGRLALGARRLAIQDLTSAGHQPMIDDQTGNCVVLNGEIYNFKELRRRLVQGGLQFRSNSDTEVLLRAYGAWGMESLSYLRGIFAFAIWDAKEQKLILARDRLGVKPLYYSESANAALIFASEVRALLKSRRVAKSLSPVGLLSYLELGALQDPRTLIEGVLALPAGHYAIWQSNHLVISEYWSLDASFAGGLTTETDQQDWPDRVRTCLREAVALRLISDAPVGVFSSGGLDSSAIVALAAQHSSRPIRTVSVIFQESGYSEKSYIDLLGKAYGTDHTEICLSGKDFLDCLPSALISMDQPTVDGVNTYVVAGQARRAGLTVALSGIGGDELFGGYPSFRRVPALYAVRRRLPPLARATAAMLVSTAGRDSDRSRKLAAWIKQGEDIRGGAEGLMRQLFASQDAVALVPEVARCSLGLQEGFGASTIRDPFNSISFFELSVYLKNMLLRDTDAMSMAHSLEVREPFLDHKLVELLALVPSMVKRRGHPKALLAEALQADLPNEILHRTKRGFVFPFATWLRGPLRKTVEDRLLDPSVGGELTSVLNIEAVAAVWQRFVSGSGSWVRPWSLYTLKEWTHRWT